LFIGRRLTDLVSPIWRITLTDDEDIDVRFVSPTVRGHLRLLAGMVLANRPWRLFSTMKSALAAAFATAAYVLVMPTIWQMADSLGWMRLLALMILAIVAMVVWIIVGHNLWERPADREARDLVALYNAATALTLFLAVVFSYAVLFVLIVVAAGIFLDSGFLQSILGHPVGPGEYVRLAWIGTSGQGWKTSKRYVRPPTATGSSAATNPIIPRSARMHSEYNNTVTTPEYNWRSGSVPLFIHLLIRGLLENLVAKGSHFSLESVLMVKEKEPQRWVLLLFPPLEFLGFAGSA
jgi:hypothetical protein